MTMKFVRTFIAVALVSIAFLGCKEAEVTEGYLRLNTAANWDGTPLVIGDVYTDVMNRPILVEQFRTYISNVSVMDSEGVEHPLKGLSNSISMRLGLLIFGFQLGTTHNLNSLLVCLHL